MLKSPILNTDKKSAGSNLKADRVKVLIVVNSHASFREMKQVAQLLINSRRYHPVILMDDPKYNYEKEISICRAESIDYLCPRVMLTLQQAGLSTNPANRVSFLRRVKEAVKHSTKTGSFVRYTLAFVWENLVSFRYSLPGALIEFMLLYCEILHQRSLTKKIKPGILVLPSADCGHLAIVTKVAAEQGIPSVVIPYAIINSTVSLKQAMAVPRMSLNRWDCRLVSWIYPQWSGEYQGRKMLASDVSKILSVEWLGLSLPKPWGDFLGRADVLAVESRCMWQLYERAGLDREKYVLTGALSDDVIFSNRRDSFGPREVLYKELDLPLGRPLILVSITPDQSLADHPGTEFNTYEQIVGFIMHVVSGAKGYNVIVSPHPRADSNVIKRFLSNNARVVDVSIESLMPLADIFIAEPSSTFRLAIACSTPAICYDMWGYEFPEFESEEGIITVETMAEFESILSRLVSDSSYYKNVKDHQAARSEEWAILDGRSGERILSLFDRMVGIAVQVNLLVPPTPNGLVLPDKSMVRTQSGEP
ncbi:MAG: hypothetical protein NT140_06080 [Deltaproteobacteria bacterium]|nr:hypothetical protein [Deltaproteobacteria bacterium]